MEYAGRCKAVVGGRPCGLFSSILGGTLKYIFLARGARGARRRALANPWSPCSTWTTTLPCADPRDVKLSHKLGSVSMSVSLCPAVSRGSGPWSGGVCAVRVWTDARRCVVSPTG